MDEDMANKAYALTDTGVHETTTDFASFSATGAIGSADVGMVTHDRRRPMLWYGVPSAQQWIQFDPESGSPVLASGVPGWKYMRACQHDQMTGDVFFLVPFMGSTSATGPYAQITRKRQATGTSALYNMSMGGAEFRVFYALDMKIDSARRRLWLLDGGAQRIVRANLDTGAVERTFAPDWMRAPCSMAVDPSTGRAYVRSLNAPAPDESESSSSSSNGILFDENDFRETVYLIDGDDIAPLVDTWSAVRYSDWALWPTPILIDEAIANGWPILPPKSGTMRFDATRGRLWWASKREERILYTLNVSDMVMESLSLQSRLDYLESIAIDHDTGGVAACGAKDGKGTVVTIDAYCSAAESHTDALSTIVRDVAIIGPELGNAVPFYAKGVEAAGDWSLSSSESSEDAVNPTEIDNSLMAEPEAAAAIVTTPTPLVTVRTWGAGDKGVMATRAWSAKDRPMDGAPVTAAISVPLFSWASSVASGSPCVAVATGGGDLVKAVYRDGELSEDGRCPSPLDGAIAGLSAANGDGNVYVSGNGRLAKVNFDPTTRAEDDESGSESSASSQSGSTGGGSGSATLSASRIVEETGVGGLSVQFHGKAAPLCSVSEEEGKLLVASGVEAWDGREEFGPLPAPFKAVWSRRHSSAVVACRNGVSMVSIPGGSIRHLYGVPGSLVTDVCCRDGDIGMAVASAGYADGLFKVVAADLSTNRLLYRTTGEFPSAACFDATGKAVVALERTEDGSARTRFAVVPVGGSPSQQSGDVVGSVASIFADENFGVVFAILTSGIAMVVSQDESGSCVATQAGDMGEAVVAAKGSLVADVEVAAARQHKARVFVGSREGASDRWDSGEVATSAPEMLYGGGDNLEPGEAYWVSVSVMNHSGAWSAPASAMFVVPIM